MHTLDEYLPNVISFKPQFKNDKLHRDLNSDFDQKDDLVEFFKALILCHQGTRRKTPSTYSKSNYKSIYSDEQAQLMLAESYQYLFVSRKNKTITLQCTHQNVRYDILVLQSFYSYDQRLTCIVIKQF